MRSRSGLAIGGGLKGQGSFPWAAIGWALGRHVALKRSRFWFAVRPGAADPSPMEPAFPNLRSVLRLPFYRRADRHPGRYDFNAHPLTLIGTLFADLAGIFEERMMEQPGLNGRHRDADGEIARKHGNTLIGTLRQQYGPAFAKGAADTAKLSDVLHSMDEDSLSKLIGH